MKKIIVLMVATSFVAHGCAIFKMWQKEWRLFDISENYSYYYDVKSIKWSADNIVRVRLKSIAKGNDAIEWELNERQKRGLSLKGYENYAYSEDIYEIDCKERKFRTLSGADYDNEGQTLSFYTTESLLWHNIPSDSTIENLAKFRSVCDTN